MDSKSRGRGFESLLGQFLPRLLQRGNPTRGEDVDCYRLLFPIYLSSGGASSLPRSFLPACLPACLPPSSMSRDFDTSSSTLADDQGRTPLLRACAVSLAFASTGRMCQVNSHCVCSAFQGHGDGIQDTIAQLLLHQEEYGVDVNCRDAFQQTALVLVRRGGGGGGGVVL